MVELTKEPDEKAVHPREMKDGQLAVIVAHPTSQRYVGRVLHRYEDVFIVVGRPCSFAFTRLASKHTGSVHESVRVRILDDGETLTVKDNK